VTEESCSIILTGQWGDSPEYWKNFIRAFDFNDDESSEERFMAVSNMLLPYGAVLDFKQEIGPSTVVFKTPFNKAWFLLRWS